MKTCLEKLADQADTFDPLLENLSGIPKAFRADISRKYAYLCKKVTTITV